MAARGQVSAVWATCQAAELVAACSHCITKAVVVPIEALYILCELYPAGGLHIGAVKELRPLQDVTLRHSILCCQHCLDLFRQVAVHTFQ